jgi:C1A family cysteine protease
VSQLIWRGNRWCPLGPAALIALVIVVLASASTYGQLSADDIKVLQDRAKVEGWTFTVGETPACQYSLKQLCGFNPDLEEKNLVYDPVPAGDRDLPSRFDWRDSCTLPAAKDQGGCGSCWAFASAGMLECNIAMKDGLSTVDLSEQWLLSCNPYGYDCENGGFDISGMFLATNDPCGDNGAVLEADFPYQEVNGTCSCPYNHHYWIESRGNVGGSLAALKQAILDYGPIYVSVTANETTWPAYNGGVYNLGDGSPTNHAVCLVGWDDSQGASGVWFMRNSWGVWWGENNGYTASGRGYMRIEYGCCNIGSNPKRLYYQPVHIEADSRLGARPHTVNFTAVAPRDTVTQATWSFGDGQYAYGATAAHQYNQTGIFTVISLIETPRGTMGDTTYDFIAVHADTMALSNVVAEPGDKVRISVNIHNLLPLKEITVPFSWAGPLSLVFDSFSTAGLRTNYFEQKNMTGYSSYWKRATIMLNCSNSGSQPYLPVGTGSVLSLWFTVPSSATNGTNPITVLDTSIYAYHPTHKCLIGEYKPTFSSGSVQCKATCCVGPTVGNVDMSLDGLVGMNDLTVLIDNLFITLTPLVCNDAGNTDLSPDKQVTMGDLTVLIDHLFITLAPLPPCP